MPPDQESGEFDSIDWSSFLAGWGEMNSTNFCHFDARLDFDEKQEICFVLASVQNVEEM